MPFRSEAQRRFLWMKHPDIARRWSQEYGSKIQPSSGQGQKHKASQDFNMTPGPVSRHTPKRADEQQAQREGGPILMAGTGRGPLGAAVEHKGFKKRDVRRAARAKLRKG